jgi:hypothetical protein
MPDASPIPSPLVAPRWLDTATAAAAAARQAAATAAQGGLDGTTEALALLLGLYPALPLTMLREAVEEIVSSPTEGR